MVKLMKKIIIVLFILASQLYDVRGQGVAINPSGAAADSSAALDVNFANKGVLIPRLTDAQRAAIQNPADGLMIFNITTQCLNIFKSNLWFEVCGNCIAPPTPQLSSNAPVCSGDSLKLFSPSYPNASYSWTGPNGFTSSLQNPVILNAPAAASGTYQLTVTTNGCTSNPGSVSVTVNQTPSASFTHAPAGVGVNANVTFTPAVSGATYSWTFQGGNPSTSNAQNPIVQWSSAGSYNISLTITQNGCTASGSSTVNVVNAVTLNTYNFTGHQYLLDCDYYSCGATTQQNANCFCQANGYSVAVSYTQAYLSSSDCFGYGPNCFLNASWCSGTDFRYVITTVTCQ
jgi:PKD repeat protein